MLLSAQYQAEPNNGGTVWDFGWPVRKGVLSDHLKLYVDKNKQWTFGYGSVDNTSGSVDNSKFNYTSITFSAPLSDEIINSLLTIESKITSAAFPPPNEIVTIQADYLNGKIDLDTALTRMQDYWNKSLQE
jgi:hypothetical protein